MDRLFLITSSISLIQVYKGSGNSQRAFATVLPNLATEGHLEASRSALQEQQLSTLKSNEVVPFGIQFCLTGAGWCFVSHG